MYLPTETETPSGQIWWGLWQDSSGNPNTFLESTRAVKVTHQPCNVYSICLFHIYQHTQPPFPCHINVLCLNLIYSMWGILNLGLNCVFVIHIESSLFSLMMFLYWSDLVCKIPTPYFFLLCLSVEKGWFHSCSSSLWTRDLKFSFFFDNFWHYINQHYIIQLQSDHPGSMDDQTVCLSLFPIAFCDQWHLTEVDPLPFLWSPPHPPHPPTHHTSLSVCLCVDWPIAVWSDVGHSLSLLVTGALARLSRPHSAHHSLGDRRLPGAGGHFAVIAKDLIWV